MSSDFYRSTSLTLTFCLSVAIAAFNSEAHAQSIKPTSQAVSPIQLSVTVIDNEKFITGLGPENFRITIDKTPAKILHFSNQSTPVSIGIVLDASGSMRKLGSEKGAKLRVIENAVSSLIALGHQANDYFLIGFNQRAQLLTDWTSKGPLITDDFYNLKPFGGTALYDACYLGINKLQESRNSRRAMILISDGQDNESRYSFNDLRGYLKEAGIILYAIHSSEIAQLGSALSMEGQAILYELSLPTGGVMYSASSLKSKQIAGIFEQIAHELRDQYTISIAPLNSNDEKQWHKIKVKVSIPDSSGRSKSASVRTREGYYSAQNPIEIPVH